MARCWSQGDGASALILFNRSCMTLPPVRGPKPAISTSPDITIRRPCCPMARCWWRGEVASVLIFLNRSCTTLRPVRGPKPAISTSPEWSIRQSCCPMARCWWRGDGGNGSYPVQSELYDPATGAWTQTGNLNFARYYHTATSLTNGKVLVAGGGSNGSSLVQSELYDPATGAWTQTGNLNFARYYHTATLLPNGKVLVAGGGSNGSSLVRRSCTTLPPARGPKPAISTSAEISIQQHC